MAHTKGEWIDGNSSDAIVVKERPEGFDGYSYPESAEYYGGYLIAESVAPNNKPLIRNAPKLFHRAKDVLEYLDKYGELNGATVSDLRAIIREIEKPEEGV